MSFIMGRTAIGELRRSDSEERRGASRRWYAGVTGSVGVLLREPYERVDS